MRTASYAELFVQTNGGKGDEEFDGEVLLTVPQGTRLQASGTAECAAESMASIL